MRCGEAIGVQDRRGGRRPTKCGENLSAMSVESWDICRCGTHPKHCLVKGEGQEGRQTTGGGGGEQFSLLLRCGQREDCHRHCVGYRVYEDAGA